MCLLFFSVREAFAIVKVELIDTRRSFSLCEHHSLLLSHFCRGEKLTGLVSRVLYDLSQQSSIFTADHSAVQALRLCHHALSAGHRSQRLAQGVASDRVYSAPMLP